MERRVEILRAATTDQLDAPHKRPSRPLCRNVVIEAGRKMGMTLNDGSIFESE